MARKRQSAGTTLIEVLVVIVIFLVGILAVVQIFPKGINILVLARNSSVATALSRDQVEFLKAHSDQLPDAIVATLPNGAYDPNRSPRNLGPSAGNSLDANGILRDNGTVIGDWMLHSGANAYRRIIGEKRAISAPRQVGNGAGYYGSLMIATFGPIDSTGSSVNVYGNDLTMHVGLPALKERTSDDQFYVAGLNTVDTEVGLPTGPVTLSTGNLNAHSRTYYVTFSGYAKPTSGGNFAQHEFRSIEVDNIGPMPPDTNGVQPLAPVSLKALAQSAGYDLASVDGTSLRVARGYTPIAKGTLDWESDEPFVYKILDAKLGVFLFSPYAFGQYVATPSGHEPMLAKLDYSVYDWRILREDFRFPYRMPAQHQLAVGVKVAGMDGADGRQIPVIDLLEDPNGTVTGAFNQSQADNFVLMDMDTGGVYFERKPLDAYDGPGTISINKSTGVVTLVDTNGSKDGTQANLLLPDGTTKEVTVDSRAVRALYRSRNEMAVQVFKASSIYDVSPISAGLETSHYYIGGSNNNDGVATRIYFPVADAGQSVSFGVINYRTTTNEVRQLLDQQFVVKTASNEALPFVDVTDVDPLATGLDLSTYGYAVRNVKGSSVSVRTLWNPDIFHLTNDATKNMQLLDAWGRGWRQSTNETFLEQGDLTR